MPNKIAIPDFSPEEIAQVKAQSAAQVPDFSPDEIARAKEISAARGKEGETFYRSGFEGATGGVSEPAISAMRAAKASPFLLASPGMAGASVLSGYLTDPSGFKQRFSEDVSARRLEKAENPTADFTGNLTGMLIPNAAPGQIFGAAGKLGTKLIPGASLLPRLGRGLVSGAMGGAASETLRQTALRPSGFITEGSAIEDIGTQTALGGVLGSATEGVFGKRPVKQAGEAGLGKKAFGVAFGVNPEAVDDYLARSTQINASPSKEAVKDKIDDITSGVRDVYKTAIGGVKDKKAELTQGFLEKKLDARDALGLARGDLASARHRVVAETADEVFNALEALKSQVSEGSAKSFNLLKYKPGTEADVALPLKTDRLVAVLRKAAKNLTIDGKTAVDATAEKSIASISKAIEGLKELPPALNQEQAKRLIMGLDRDLKAMYSSVPGSFAPGEVAAKSRLRSYADAALKRVSPEYKQAMVGVSEDAKLLSEARSAFGSESGALRKLEAISAGKEIPEGKALNALGRRFQTDFASKASEKNLPEYKKVLEAQANIESLRPDLVRGEIKTALEGSRETDALRRASERLNPIKSLSNKGSQSLIERGIRGKDVEARKTLEYLSSLSNEDFASAIKNLRTTQAFEGSRANGFRRAGTFGTAGAALGTAAFGPAGGAIMAGIGSSIGFAMDQYGPQVAKKVLDGVIAMKGAPTYQKISALSVPNAVKDALAKELKLIPAVGGLVARPDEEKNAMKRRQER